MLDSAAEALNLVNGNIADCSAGDNSGEDARSSAVVLAMPQRRQAEISFTILTAGPGNAVPSKRFGLGSDGRPAVTHQGGQPAAGTVRRVLLRGTAGDALRELGGSLSELSPRQALICAPPAGGRDEWQFLTQGEAEGRTDVIARTREHFPAVQGTALFALDFDIKAWPAELRARVAKHDGQLTGVLTAVFAGFADCAWLRRASSSAGVRDKLTRRGADGNAGQHRFYIVPDGMDVERFASVLHRRLILAGWGYGQVTESGVVHIRSLIDEAASKDVGRLWFEGSVVLEDDRLEIDPEARAPALFRDDGGALDTRTLVDLNDDEAEWFEVVCAGIRDQNRAAAEAKRVEWKAQRGNVLSGRGVPAERAAKILSGALERHELSGDWPVHLDGGRTVSVDEILDNPAAFHKKTCADPLEPDYGGGRNKAVLYTDKPPVRIFSQAHGGIDYRLTRTPEHWFSDLGPVDAQAAIVPTESVSAAIVSGEWVEPRDVFGDDTSSKLLELPAGSLPLVIEEWARDTAERIGVPSAFMVGGALATVSAAIGSRLRVQPKALDTTWTEPGFLWVAIVDQPGSLKSPAVAQATKPLDALDAEHSRIDEKRRAAWEQAAKLKRKTGVDPGPEPRSRRYVANGFTMEALAKILANSPTSVLVKQDELAGLIGSLDAYKANRGSDRPMLLQLFDGRSTSIDRVQAGRTFVDCWGASVIGGIQPKKIAEMADGLDGDGLLQRFIPIFGDGRPREGIDREPDRFALEAYDRTVRGIATAEYGFDRTIRLSERAQSVWRPLQARIRALHALPNVSDAWRGHLGKWPGISARILLICHVLEEWEQHRGGVGEVPVSADTAGRAARVVDWLIGHSLRFYEECIGAGEAGKDARWIAGYILSRGALERITRREIGRAYRGLRGDAGRIGRAMRYLDQMDWCRPDDAERVDRDGVSRWVVNPSVFAQFANRADSERIRREIVQTEIQNAISERTKLRGDA